MRLKEGGHATEQWGTTRANQADMQAALKFMSKASGISVEELRNGLLGSTELTLLGFRPDSGDVDIAIDLNKYDMTEVHNKVLAAVSNEGVLASGLRTGSYACPVGNGKKIQVDFMYFDSVTWAKFMYHSDEGRNSKFKGVVRNQLLMACVRHMIHPGDMVIKNDAGEIVARASRSIDPNKGMRRIFKMVSINKRTGAPNKTLGTVTPAEIRARYPDAQFIDREDLVNDPQTLVHALFGEDVEPASIMTVEDLMDIVKNKVADPKLRETIGLDAATTLDRDGIPYPPSLKQL
jgi:hypothetical protein